MKRELVILMWLLTAVSLKAQQSPELAFSKSCAFEYDTQYDKAITALQELKSDSYEVNLRLGWLYYLNKDNLKSQAHYKRAITIEPGSVEARFGLALPLSAQNNWTEVLSVYQEILKQDPNNSIANYRVATIYYNRKEYANARLNISKVIRMYPFDYDSNLLYGKILIAQGKATDAKKYLTKALEYNPQSDEVKALIKKL